MSEYRNIQGPLYLEEPRRGGECAISSVGHRGVCVFERGDSLTLDAMNTIGTGTAHLYNVVILRGVLLKAPSLYRYVFGYAALFKRVLLGHYGGTDIPTLWNRAGLSASSGDPIFHTRVSARCLRELQSTVPV